MPGDQQLGRSPYGEIAPAADPIDQLRSDLTALFGAFLTCVAAILAYLNLRELTIDTTGKHMTLNYVTNGSVSGKCETDDGIASLAKK
jgi:hypothetical protein